MAREFGQAGSLQPELMTSMQKRDAVSRAQDEDRNRTNLYKRTMRNLKKANRDGDARAGMQAIELGEYADERGIQTGGIASFEGGRERATVSMLDRLKLANDEDAAANGATWVDDGQGGSKPVAASSQQSEAEGEDESSNTYAGPQMGTYSPPKLGNPANGSYLAQRLGMQSRFSGKPVSSNMPGPEAAFSQPSPEQLAAVGSVRGNWQDGEQSPTPSPLAAKMSGGTQYRFGPAPRQALPFNPQSADASIANADAQLGNLSDTDIQASPRLTENWQGKRKPSMVRDSQGRDFTYAGRDQGGKQYRPVGWDQSRENASGRLGTALSLLDRVRGKIPFGAGNYTADRLSIGLQGRLARLEPKR